MKTDMKNLFSNENLLFRMQKEGLGHLKNWMKQVKIVEMEDVLYFITKSKFVADRLNKDFEKFDLIIRQISKHAHLQISEKHPIKKIKKTKFRKNIEFVYRNGGENFLIAVRQKRLKGLVRAIRKILLIPPDGFVLEELVKWEAEQIKKRGIQFELLILTIKELHKILELTRNFDILLYLFICLRERPVEEFLEEINICQFKEMDKFENDGEEFGIIFPYKSLEFFEGLYPFIFFRLSKYTSKNDLLKIWDKHSREIKELKKNMFSHGEVRKDSEIAARNFITYKLVKDRVSRKQILGELTEMGFKNVNPPLIKKSIQNFRNKMGDFDKIFSDNLFRSLFLLKFLGQEKHKEISYRKRGKAFY